MPHVATAHPAHRRAGWLLAIGGFLAVCALTLFPTQGQPQTSLFCVVCGERSLLDAILNVLLFVPLGAGLALLGVTTRRAALLGFALSVTVEILQLTIVPGRDPSLRDVLTNGLGSLAGVWLGRNLRLVLCPPPRLGRVLAIGTALLWVGFHAAGDWSTQPSLAANRAYAAPRIDTPLHESFEGELVAATINDRTLETRVTPIAQAELERSQGRHGVVRVTAVVVPVSRERESSRVAPITMLVHGSSDIVLLLGRRGSSLVFDVRSHASDARLNPLTFEFDRVFPDGEGKETIGAPGEPLSISATLAPGRIIMSASSRERSRTQVERIGPALPWIFLLPFDLPLGRLTSAGALVWLFGSLIPIGFWGAKAASSARAPARTAWILTLGIILPAIALVLFPFVFGVGFGTPAEWVAAEGGLLAGAWLARPRRFG